MAGASQPPFRSEESLHDSDVAKGRASPLPSVHFPQPPALPSDDAESETAEHLTLPHGVSPEKPLGDPLPRTPSEARVLFTHLSRDLGHEYRIARGIELRTDANALEAMQAHLFDAYHADKVRSLDEWLDVRRHGAFLSEILARTVGAEWTDISPGELGYWTMTIPHRSGGITRVWPFARVLRYVTMGPRERDLVAYYLELKSRVRER